VNEDIHLFRHLPITDSKEAKSCYSTVNLWRCPVRCGL